MTLVAEDEKRSAAGRTAVRIMGRGYATPGHVDQEVAAERCYDLCCADERQRQFMERIYSHAGVRRRGSVLVDEGDVRQARTRAFFRPRTGVGDRGPTTAERMAMYARFAPELAARACAGALVDGDVAAGQITHLVIATCTGFFAPGLDVELIGRLGLAATVQRVQVGFMGCHGAFNALLAARGIAAAEPGARVLVVCVELCSLHLAYGFDPQKLVANSLFADGAAAVVVGMSGDTTAGAKGACGMRLLESSSMLIPESRDAMTWRIGDHGFEMTLSTRVPELVRRHLKGWLVGWLGQGGLGEIKCFAVHPGGPKVLTAVGEALGIGEGAMAASRQVLAEHGNMSSATVLFVLEELVKRGETGRCLALGFGPGLTAEGMVVEI